MRPVPWLEPDQADTLEALDRMPPPDTRKFREWFGNSQVLRRTRGDPDNIRRRCCRGDPNTARPVDPLIVYHGTRAGDLFTAFQTERKLPRRGARFMQERSNDPNTFYGPHFTDDAEVALKFATAEYSWIPKTERDVPRVYPVYLRIENPMAYEAEYEMHYDIAHKAMEAGYKIPKEFIEDYLAPAARAGELITRYLVSIIVSDPADFRRLMREDEDFREQVYEVTLDTFQDHQIGMWMLKMVRKAKERLIELGYDGIWYTNEGEGGNGWIPFHPNQIKSAIANDGTYGPSKDIRRNPR